VVSARRPVMLLVKLPVPVPSLVWLPAVVGLAYRQNQKRNLKKLTIED